ncbi:hypothetical protein MKW92_046050 [Papaver armeniacum]|nr:hypothetical protein MKW92_046050 [Papaver armeniacum]
MACLFEKEIDFEVETIRLELGEHKRPSSFSLCVQMLSFLDEFNLMDCNSHFLPFGQVHVVEDGDFRLFESRAIIRYYATKYLDQGTNLLGKTLEERALVDQWLEVEAHNFNELIYTIVFQVVILPRMEKLGKVLDIYEEQLSKNGLSSGRLIRPRRGEGLSCQDGKNVNAWWEDISNRLLGRKFKLMEKN